MESKVDELRNPDAFMQIGDFVASTFLFSALCLLGVSIFILMQLRSVPQRWKLPVMLSVMVALITALVTLFRWHYWVSTETNPVEFRFLDWFLTVPLMSVVFFYLLKPLGVSRWMLPTLFLSTLWMLSWGYFGEALQPERSLYWGIMGSLGLAAIVATIMGVGYPKVLVPGIHPNLRAGYLFLSGYLPVVWSLYPLGYLTVPGNLLEGAMAPDQVAIMYNLADIASKAGLAIGVVYVAAKTGDDPLHQPQPVPAT